MIDMHDLEDFGMITSKTDITKFDALSQLEIMAAYTKFVESIKPIYVKNMTKTPEISKFIIKL